MTLNITVATHRCIYQSADYRLVDLRTGKEIDFETQKVALINRARWSATVCFAGVGRTNNLDVSEWLVERIAAVASQDPLERLIEELLMAEAWLAPIPPPNNRHSFTIGAFVGSKPEIVLISNFEELAGKAASIASSQLSVFRKQPKQPISFFSGQRQAVKRADRRQLEMLAAKDPPPEAMYSLLADVNRRVARRVPRYVSDACFTAHVRLTGEGGGRPHGLGNRPFSPKFALSGNPTMDQALQTILDKQFGPGKSRLVQIAFARADESEEYHATQLREKPNDPNTHSNYGAFLLNKNKDREAAIAEYRKALELDPHHVNALGNLGNVLWDKGEKHQASDLYKTALASDPGNANVSRNYSNFLIKEFADYEAAGEILDRGIEKNPESADLLLLRAELNLERGNPNGALDDIRQAREKGADQAQVETVYACALHMSGAANGEVIAAYRVAIPLAPQVGNLRLNLAQLLFIRRERKEALAQLNEAMRLGLDESAQLEAQFYLLAHTSTDAQSVEKEMTSLLSRGARLRWNVNPNIRSASHLDPNKAAALEAVRDVLVGTADSSLLQSLLAKW